MMSLRRRSLHYYTINNIMYAVKTLYWLTPKDMALDQCLDIRWPPSVTAEKLHRRRPESGTADFQSRIPPTASQHMSTDETAQQPLRTWHCHGPQLAQIHYTVNNIMYDVATEDFPVRQSISLTSTLVTVIIAVRVGEHNCTVLTYLLTRYIFVRL